MTGIAPLDPGGAQVGPDDVIAALGLRTRGPVGDRPRVAAVMIASVDGRATVAGRSGGLGHPMDRAVMRGLRADADAVLVGAATVRAERYANLLDPEVREARARAGRPRHPPVAVMTRTGDVPWEVGLFAEQDVSVVIGTDAPIDIPARVTARVELAPGAAEAVLAGLRATHGADVVLCEGGPRLLAALAAEGLLDDLVLTVAPLLAGGDGPGLLTGPPLDPPPALALAGAWRADDHLFLHYTA